MYQTSRMPAFQHSLICHLSPGERFPCHFQLCLPGGTWLTSRGVVVETCGVHFAMFFGVRGRHASVPEDPEQSPTSSSPAFFTAAPWVAGVGQNRVLMGEMVVLEIPLSFSVRLGTWRPNDYTGLEKDTPCHAGTCEGRSRRVSRPSPGTEQDL